jgi:hypothetical protein
MKKGDKLIYQEGSILLKKNRIFYFDYYDIHDNNFAYVIDQKGMSHWVPINFFINLKQERKEKIQKLNNINETQF